MDEIMAGGHASLLWAEECEAETMRLMGRFFDRRATEFLLNDDAQLPTLHMFLDSEGTDTEALETLRRATEAPLAVGR